MDEQFTIQISTNLVKQLAKDVEKPTKKVKKPKPKVQKKPQQPETKVNEKPLSDGLQTHPNTPAAVWPTHPPFFLPAPPTPEPAANPELDAIRSVLQESERVVDRLQKQEESMVQEVTERAKELHDKEFKLPYQKPMPCLAERDACLECYREHTKDPLKCADLVNSFADCARKVRQHMSSNR